MLLEISQLHLVDLFLLLEEVDKLVELEDSLVEVEVDLVVEYSLQLAMVLSQTLDQSHLLVDQLDLVEDLDLLLDLEEH
jgi:hypothetical protein